eukprot:CAMPEP_0194066248 /NCGR_PEP_ID=MMETSP0009_2-20130614/85917_1 /TAXON_ID=210454 /ORGANISM="Grammatophora oceanica, Strain CCMP 410" /LENGTH=166 /DNA_ID=CAMNT_0038719179 /DNA_START=24 /DNA_END=524 /DNA_ORIENTATION=+
MTMMKVLLPCSLLLLLSTTVHALIPLHPTNSHHSLGGSSRSFNFGGSSLLKLKAASSGDNTPQYDDDDDLDAFRERIEDMYMEDHIFPWDSEDEEIPDWMAGLAASACVGEDCEECLIPDIMYSHHTTAPTKKDTEDLSREVMQFLGIRRAEPIRVPQRSSTSSSS